MTSDSLRLLADLAARLGAGEAVDVSAARSACTDREAVPLLDALASIAARVERSAAARETLIAGVAHDLRNPLNTLAMSAGLLRDDLESEVVDTKRALGFVVRLDRSIDRMRRMIDDLSDASRIEAKKVDLTKTREPLAQLARDAEPAAVAAAKERGGSFALGSLDDDAIALVDRARLLQTIEKLAAFAVRLTGEGGTMSLSVVRVERGVRVELVVRARSGSVTLPDENRGGIALLIARSLVELSGARLELVAQDGGAVLGFTLPAAS